MDCRGRSEINPRTQNCGLTNGWMKPPKKKERPTAKPSARCSFKQPMSIKCSLTSGAATKNCPQLDLDLIPAPLPEEGSCLVENPANDSALHRVEAEKAPVRSRSFAWR